MLLLAIVAAGCGSDGSSPTNGNGGDVSGQLVETAWVLSEVYRGAEAVQLDPLLSTRSMPGVASWVSFAPGGSFEGEGPCNRFRGSYVLDDDSLRVHSGSMQAGGCPVGPEAADAATATAAELLIVTPFISESRFEVTLTEEDLLLSAEAISLVYVKPQSP